MLDVGEIFAGQGTLGPDIGTDLNFRLDLLRDVLDGTDRKCRLTVVTVDHLGPLAHPAHFVVGSDDTVDDVKRPLTL